jgi:hypothetical protein
MISRFGWAISVLELGLIQTKMALKPVLRCCGQKFMRMSCAQVKILRRLVCREQEAQYFQPPLKWKPATMK